MAFTRQDAFSKKVTDLPDTPSPSYTANDIKSYFETPSDELMTTVNDLMNDLEANTGAGNIGAKKTDGTTTTVQTEITNNSNNFSIHKTATTLDHPDKSVVESKLADKSVSRRTIQAGAVGTNEIDPSILAQPTTAIGQQAKFDSIDAQLADIATNSSERGVNVLYPPAPAVALKGDGVTDDSNGLLNLSNNYDFLFFPNATYLINTSITISKPLKMYGGHNTVITRTNTSSITLGSGIDHVHLENLIFDGASQESTFLWINALNTYIRHCTFKNNGTPGYSAGHSGSIDGLRLSGQKALIDGCTFDKNERDGLLCGAVETLRVSNCVFTNNGRFGSANDGGIATTYFPKDTHYVNNYAYNNGSGGLHCEGNPTYQTERGKIVYNNNIIDSCGGNDWGLGWCVTIGHYCEGSITGNVFTNFNPNNKSNLYAIQLNTNMGEVTITGNSIRNCLGTSIYSSQTVSTDTPLVITGNSFMQVGVALFLYYQNNVVFTGNRVDQASNQAINVDLINNLLISGNVILNSSQSGSGSYSGIYLSRATYSTIVGNIINSANQKYGIEIASGTDVTYTNIGDNHISSFVTAWCSFANGTTKGRQSLRIKEFFGTAIPTNGTWSVGDKVWNTSPVASGAIGWVCTTAGTPGTWKTFGTIGA